MTMILLLFSVFHVSAQETTIEQEIGRDAAEQTSASAPVSEALAQQNNPELMKVKACLDRIAEKGALTTKDYATTGTDHFLFSSVVPKSLIYLGAKGIFECKLNWPSNRQFSFSIDGKSMAPYGKFPSSGNLTSRQCSELEDYGKMINQAQANLKYLGKADPKNCGTIKKFIRGACKTIPRAEEYVQKGCNDQGLPAGVTIHSGDSSSTAQ
jgi:hypothetical protein